MSFDINIYKKNESTVKIVCSDYSIYEELSRYFTLFAPNYLFHPSYKARDMNGNRKWDGKLRFFNVNTSELAIGLIGEVKEFAKKGDYTVKFHTESYPIVNREEFKVFVDGLNITNEKNEPMELRDFQFEAAYDAINLRHLNISSSTSSGKTLITYVIVRWLVKEGLKVLCIFPNTMLVEQIYSDFSDYGWQEVDDNCCMIYSGKKRMMERNVIFSTFQSLAEKYHEDLKLFGCVIFDEAHHLVSSGTTAKMMATIAKNSINAFYRIGLSGSYPDKGSVDWLSVVGATGQIKVYSTYKTLQEAGQIANHKIVVVRLNYTDKDKYHNYNTNIVPNEEGESTAKYNAEASYLYGLDKRNVFIGKLINKLKGNTLVLFSKKETHGIPMFEKMKTMLAGKTLLYIDGDVPMEERELSKRKMEELDDVVLFATYQTLSTGINIKRIHNIIFASGTKSRIKVIQSCGRGLRLHETKDILTIYDIVDDFSFKDTNKHIEYINYGVEHFKERYKLYQQQEFDVSIITYQMKE
jgi:superfamily II DNA or RNA helicase